MLINGGGGGESRGNTVPVVTGPIPEPDASSSSSWPSSSSSIPLWPRCLQPGLSPLPEPSRASSARKASVPKSDANWDCTTCHRRIAERSA
ncbi:hypothetical protein PUN28_010850 [Cardiocondyla obscurior]|uniref:Uncharacterized protein n=1 Tax=Cardiocondyla obscurior TaxID=286306 RepID=A0AAW2FI24_9HYME